MATDRRDRTCRLGEPGSLWKMWCQVVLVLLLVQRTVAHQTTASPCPPEDDRFLRVNCSGRYGDFCRLAVECDATASSPTPGPLELTTVPGFRTYGELSGPGWVTKNIRFALPDFQESGMNITCDTGTGDALNISFDKDSDFVRECWRVNLWEGLSIGGNNQRTQQATVGSKVYTVAIPMIGGEILTPTLNVIENKPPVSSIVLSGLSPGAKVTRFASDIIDIVVTDENGDVITDFTNHTITLSFSTSPYDPLKEEPVCSFLDEKTGSWSTEGCHVSGTAADSVECACDHLTSFAILMQTVEVQISERHATALSVLTTIGLTCSITCLGLTLAIYAICRLRSLRILIHGNLAFSIMTSHVVFLFVGTIEQAGCRAVAVLLHFFLLAAFAWMAIEGVFLLIKSTPTFSRRIKMPVWFAIGWGVPLVIVLISLGARVSGYGEPGRCWLNIAYGFNWAFLTPAILSIVFNTAVLFRLIRIFMSLQTNKKKAEAQKMKAGIRLVLILEPLLGFPWLLGLLYFSPETIVYAYIFVACNSLQGVFLFVSQCLCDEEVRQRLRAMYSKRSTRVTSMATASFSMDSVSKTAKGSCQQSEIKTISGKDAPNDDGGNRRGRAVFKK